MGRGHGRGRCGHDGGHNRLYVQLPAVNIQQNITVVNNHFIVNNNSTGSTSNPQALPPNPTKSTDPAPPQGVPINPPVPPKPLPQPQNPVDQPINKPVVPPQPAGDNTGTTGANDSAKGTVKTVEHDIFYLIDVYRANEGPKSSGDLGTSNVKPLRREVWYFVEQNLATRNYQKKVTQKWVMPKDFEKWEGRMFTLPDIQTPIHIGVIDGSDVIQPSELIRAGSAGVPKPVGYAGVYLLPKKADTTQRIDLNNAPQAKPSSGIMLPIYRDEKKIKIKRTEETNDEPALDWVVNYYITSAPPLKIETPAATAIPSAGAAPIAKPVGRMAAAQPSDFALVDDKPSSMMAQVASVDNDVQLVSNTTIFSQEASTDFDEPESYDEMMDNAPDENELINGRPWGGMLLFDAVMSNAGLDSVPFVVMEQPSTDEGPPRVDAWVDPNASAPDPTLAIEPDDPPALLEPTLDPSQANVPNSIPQPDATQQNGGDIQPAAQPIIQPAAQPAVQPETTVDAAPSADPF